MNEVKIILSGKEAKSIRLHVPSNWDELWPDQVRALAEYRFGNHLGDDIAKQQMLFALLQLTRKDLAEVMDLLLDPTQDVQIMDLYTLMEWTMDSVVWGKDKYPTPDWANPIGPDYKNIALGQFFVIEAMWDNYRKVQDIESMHMVLAAVYPCGEFEEESLEEDAKLWEDVVLEDKRALLLNFIAQRNNFTQMYKSLFPEPEENDDEEDEPVVVNYYEQLMDMVFDLPSDQFGPFEKKLKMPVHNGFMYIEKLKRDLKKVKPNEV